MEKLLIKLFFIPFLCSLLVITGAGIVNAEKQATDYEKWGKIAVDVAKLNYTDSKISDYQYIGREELTETQAKDTFELKVQNENRTFTAKVVILFNPKTNSLLSMSVEEVK